MHTCAGGQSGAERVVSFAGLVAALGTAAAHGDGEGLGVDEGDDTLLRQQQLQVALVLLRVEVVEGHRARLRVVQLRQICTHGVVRELCCFVVPALHTKKY